MTHSHDRDPIICYFGELIDPAERRPWLIVLGYDDEGPVIYYVCPDCERDGVLEDVLTALDLDQYTKVVRLCNDGNPISDQFIVAVQQTEEQCRSLLGWDEP
jgi:hypothetical protein